jgi:hypothetical protein
LEKVVELNKDSVSCANTVYVKVNDRTISVKKLGLIKYAQLTGSLKEVIISLFEIFKLQDDLKFQNLLSANEDEKSSPDKQVNVLVDAFVSLIETNITQVVKVLDIAIPDIGYDYIENEIGLDDVLVLVNAVLEVNNVNKVVTEGKKLMTALLSPKA